MDVNLAVCTADWIIQLLFGRRLISCMCAVYDKLPVLARRGQVLIPWAYAIKEFEGKKIKNEFCCRLWLLWAGDHMDTQEIWDVYDFSTPLVMCSVY